MYILGSHISVLVVSLGPVYGDFPMGLMRPKPAAGRPAVGGELTNWRMDSLRNTACIIKQHLNPIFRLRFPKPSFPAPGPFKTGRGRV